MIPEFSSCYEEENIMAESSELKVTVSRKLLLILTLVGALFLAVGLDIMVFHKVVGPEMGADKPIVKWAFAFFSIGIGGAIALNCFLYLIVPPTLLRVTKDRIIFGCGLRYKPFELPCRLLEKIETYSQVSMLQVNGKSRTVDGGALFLFKNDPSIPSQMATSMGAIYYGFQLKINSTYAAMNGPKMVEAAHRITGK
jgi:hypothetical protein